VRYVIVLLVVFISCSPTAKIEVGAYMKGYFDGWSAHEKFDKDSIAVFDSLMRVIDSLKTK